MEAIGPAERAHEAAVALRQQLSDCSGKSLPHVFNVQHYFDSLSAIFQAAKSRAEVATCAAERAHETAVALRQLLSESQSELHSAREKQVPVLPHVSPTLCDVVEGCTWKL